MERSIINIQSEEDFKIAEARLDVMAGAIPGTIEAMELKGLTQAMIDYLKKQNSNQDFDDNLPSPKVRPGLF